jgi:hypothetical protein
MRSEDELGVEIGVAVEIGVGDGGRGRISRTTVIRKNGFSYLTGFWD